MPTITLPEQNGNSCAAHCTVIAVSELLGGQLLLNQDYAENNLWPSIQFKKTGGPFDGLADNKNSDPRLIITEMTTRWNTIKKTLVCDETQKKIALTYVNNQMQQELGGLFTLLRQNGTAKPVILEEGIYYNCTYLMIKGSNARKGVFEGMHNILVTKEGGKIYYYNPNETMPKWSVVLSNWTRLDNQNDGNYSYVFTGVCVEMSK